MNEERTENRRALITGGAKRIGKAIASDLAGHGWCVAIHCQESTAEAHALSEEISAGGGSADVLVADLTDARECRQLFSQATARLGPIDLLVNNASIFEPDSALQPDMELFDRHFALHAKAPVLLSAAFAAQASQPEGLVVNLIDQRVWALTPRYFSYTLSKSALWTATRIMAQEFAPRIRVNAIGPGPTLPNDRQSEEDFARQVAALPLQRSPDLSEFGATIRYLHENRSITGQMIALDGGEHLAWNESMEHE